MNEPQIVSLWSEPWVDRERFLGSGMLLDRSHILTAKHVIEKHGEVFVSLIAGRAQHTSARALVLHDRFDAALLELTAATPIEVPPPPLLGKYRDLTGRPITLYAISPANWGVQKPTSYSIGSYDVRYRDYELLPENARGHSGGVVVCDGVVVALLHSRAANDPLCFALSLHALEEWIRQWVPLPDSDKSERVCGPIALWNGSDRGEPGFSHRLGSIHLHVDGAHASDYVHELVERHKRLGYRAELAAVDAFVAGPQRKALRNAYTLHTPGSPEKEELDFFSTTLLHEGPGLPESDELNRIWKVTHDTLADLHARGARMANVVVELERVVATVDPDGAVAMHPAPLLPSASSDRIRGSMIFAPFNAANVTRMDAARYELHFSIDIDHQDSNIAVPLELEYLLDITTRAGIQVGGWFLFHDRQRWAYRSNSFDADVNAQALKSLWCQLRDQLDRDASPVIRNARLRLLAEEAIAVWRTELVKRSSDFLTVPELARWERTFPKLVEFWVAAPNFLGDQDRLVEEAMLVNLNRGVKYVYFLRSDADAKRWLAFRDRLEDRVGAAARGMAAYVVGFRQPGEWDQSFAFIANPQSSDPSAVSLRLDPLLRQVFCGVSMPEATTRRLIAAFEPILQGGAIAQVHPVMSGGPAVDAAALCVHFDQVPEDSDMDRLDSEVAIEASLCDGEVVLYGGKSIIVLFGHGREGLARAVRCAVRISSKVERTSLCTLGIRLGIDYGEARQVARACGLVWSGPSIRGCRQTLECARTGPGIFLTPDAAAVYSRSGLWPDVEVKNTNTEAPEVVAR